MASARNMEGATMAKSFKTPFADLLPPLSTDEFSALKASIAVDGVRAPVFLDEDENVLDGHNRLRIDPDAPRKIIRGLTEAEKRAFVFQANLARRNLSPSQKKEAAARMRKVANDLRSEDPKKNTQARVAMLLGVTRQAVSLWWGDATNASACNGCVPRPDARVKLPPEHKPVIAQRVAKGETQEQVAADYGVSRQAVSKVVKQEAKQIAAKQAVERAAENRGTDFCGVHLGDFRGVGDCVADESVDLIFTDPPYDESAVSLYGDLAEFAARVLRPGGWCLAYSGQSFLPAVLPAMSAHLEYGWTFAITHSGGDLRFRKFKLQNKWKPIVGFFKPPLGVWWDWFPDLATGGREKTAHEWQQALGEAEHFIDALSPKAGLICDPFCGGGTTCVAAKSLKRNWVAFEIEERHVKIARKRIEDSR